MIFSLSGTGVSDGIAMGHAHLLSSGELELPEYELENGDVSVEIDRLHQAAWRCREELARMEADLGGERRGSTAELLQAHRLMVEDDMLLGEACRRIRQEKINAEWALDRQAAVVRREFRRIEDDYLALRVEDLDQVLRLLQRQLADQPAGVLDARVPYQLDETVVLADALSPAELAALHQRRVAGLVTEHGSTWSHAAIVARGMGIPMVVAVHRSQRLLREGEPLILDSHYGIVLATRDERLHAHYAEKMALFRRNRRNLQRVLGEPDRTADGTRFRLLGNAEVPDELERCNARAHRVLRRFPTAGIACRPPCDRARQARAAGCADYAEKAPSFRRNEHAGVRLGSPARCRNGCRESAVHPRAAGAASGARQPPWEFPFRVPRLRRGTRYCRARSPTRRRGAGAARRVRPD